MKRKKPSDVLHHAADYRRRRQDAVEGYPPLGDFADAFVKSYQDQLDTLPTPLREYVQRCLDVKAKFSKG